MEFQDICASLAGGIAEDRFRGRKGSQEPGDWERARESALRLSSRDEECADLLLKWAERRTELLVEKLWNKIEKLAGVLSERRLSGEEISAILNGNNGA